jgi:hypothetical protein
MPGAAGKATGGQTHGAGKEPAGKPGGGIRHHTRRCAGAVAHWVAGCPRMVIGYQDKAQALRRVAPLARGRATQAAAAVAKHPTQALRWVYGQRRMRLRDLAGLSVAVRYGPHYALTGVHRTYRPEPVGTKPRALHLERRQPAARKPKATARTRRPADGGGHFWGGGGHAAAVGYAPHPESRRFFAGWRWAMAEFFRKNVPVKRRSGGDPFGRWARWYGRHGEAKRAWAREWMRKKRALARAAAQAAATAPAMALAPAIESGTVAP